MPGIIIEHLSFTYPGSYTPVFSDLSFSMDTSWRLGLVGRNGRGKTTLLRLLSGELKGQGRIETTARFDCFPFQAQTQGTARHCLREAIAPFEAWEQEMAALLARGDEESLKRWGEIEQLYGAQDGYLIDSLIDREADKMGISPELLERPFLSFSPGERTRLLLCALFLRKNRFLLIDEPTNHLDMRGRDIAAEYLAGKSGFLLVSHDRSFLDRSVDHIMALQKNSIRIEKGNYSSYRANKKAQDEFELAQNERLKKDIRRLNESAREKALWSDKVEASKFGSHPSDRGYIGHKSAKMMKRSLAIENRLQRSVEEKEKLLKDIEYQGSLSLHPLPHPARVLLSALGLSFHYPNGPLLVDGLNLRVTQGQRIAITGCNGAGKSTLLKLLEGRLQPTDGTLSRPGGLIISTLPQEAWQIQGTPFEIAEREGLAADYFLTLLRKFGFPREAFTRDASGFSMGQQKKLLLAASMARPAHLYLWDEPLNYIDLESREQIEDMLAETDATLIFVEHDRQFVERVATEMLNI